MNKAIIVSLAFVLTVLPFIADAEERKPKKLANVEYLSITYTDFKSGKADRAMEIIFQHLKQLELQYLILSGCKVANGI